MNVKQLITICLLAAASISTASAQDTIMLMRGKRLLVNDSKIEITAKGDTVVSYQLPNGKHKRKSIDKVFSVNNKDGEQIFFTLEEMEDELLTVEQMRRFLQGKADFKGKFSWGFYAGGIAATAVGAAISPVGFNVGSSHANVPIGALVPFGYVFIVGNTSKSYKKIMTKYQGLPNDDYYILGVQAAISQYRMRDAALGVLTGGIIWIAASCISN